MTASAMAADWSRFWVDYRGRRNHWDTFGADFLPELKRILDTHAVDARSFLEWGSGLSTLLLGEVAQARGGQVVSLEDDAGFSRSVASRLPPGAAVRCLASDLTGPKVGQDDAGLNYATLPLEMGEEFDFILVDGRRRLECLLTAFLLARPATVVLLDDYRRRRYQPAEVLFETVEAGPRFWVLRPRPGLLAATAADRARVVASLLASAGQGEPPTAQGSGLLAKVRRKLGRRSS